MNKVHKTSAELRTYCLSIRWNADQHRILSDTAWRARKSISDFVRGIVLAHLKRGGVKIG